MIVLMELQRGNAPPPLVLFHPNATTWAGKLREARSEMDVVAVVRDFVALLTPEEFARIPERLRPGRFVDAHDVTSYGFDLVRHECEDKEGRRVVRRMARFFSEASIRLSEILVASPRSEEDDEPMSV